MRARRWVAKKCRFLIPKGIRNDKGVGFAQRSVGLISVVNGIAADQVKASSSARPDRRGRLSLRVMWRPRLIRPLRT